MYIEVYTTSGGKAYIGSFTLHATQCSLHFDKPK